MAPGTPQAQPLAPTGKTLDQNPAASPTEASRRKSQGTIEAQSEPANLRNRAAPAARFERLLSVREVAAYLSVSSATVYRVVNNGELKHIRVGNAVRVAPASLEAFIADAASRQ